ncbi:GntR family transcriptional regulator [Paenibacillus silvestris]|nr:GntR family transcriptional regulator [Paenibacillus silvestris]
MESQTPLYQQIIKQIVEGILSGGLQTGESLPSVRRLASDIGINIHTVSKSYKVLQQQGYIRMHRRKGAVIAELIPERKSEPQHIVQLKEMLHPIVVWSVRREISSAQINLVVAELIQSIHNDTEGDHL